MKQEIAQQWTAALRSGEYQQGKHYLHTDNTYCCLGVLCELYKHAHPDQQPDTPGGYFGHTSALPSAVQSWAGMCSQRGEVPGEHTLAHLNDGGVSFTDIANIIDCNWASL